MSAGCGSDPHLAWRDSFAGLVAYITQDDLHNRLTPRIIDIAYTAFMIRAQGKNSDDGGPCDWYTDTRPVVLEAIAKLKRDLDEAQVQDQEETEFQTWAIAKGLASIDVNGANGVPGKFWFANKVNGHLAKREWREARKNKREPDTSKFVEQEAANPIDSMCRESEEYLAAVQEICQAMGWHRNKVALVDKDGVFRMRTDDAVKLSRLNCDGRAMQGEQK